ncbi:unnamed protein product [Adineta ricciae]|uniref:Transmembrane protein n=1 Tax=Adineta ricciae TaxID=249248 RepID=A0A814WPS7_ADIRI|nr:unnamed protein product [Adineta ricciae]CAF1205176.1 unnamed protein product [Adineta ricciae]
MENLTSAIPPIGSSTSFVSTSTILTTITSTMLTSTRSSNITNITNSCLLKNSPSTCRLGEFIRVLAYLFLGVSLLPQILHLFNNGSKYIAGISYMWLIIRVLALTSLVLAHAFQWSSILELIALISTIIIFIQIFIYADNFHRQQKIILISASLLTWAIGGFLLLLIRKRPDYLLTFGYILLSIHTLPQILLNSLLRTAKSLSKFSILFLSMSDTLFFASIYVSNENYFHLVLYYYAFSFFFYIYLQSIIHADSNIFIISRSAHTVLTPGVNLYTGLDATGVRSAGQEPQMFSIDDLETGDGTDVVYQPVTSTKPAVPTVEQTRMNQIVWYATLASIIAIEITLTIMLIVRAWSEWIILVPVSIPVVLGIFFLLRTRLSDFQKENLRKVL